MFGKTEWFRTKAIGWGIQPVRWQGWAYALAWIVVITAPSIALISRQQIPEALVWLSAAIGTLLWDVHGIRRDLRSTDERGVLYIGEDEVGEQLATRR